MKKYLEEPEFTALQERLERGATRILVERSVARQVFTHVPNKSIIETTGESMMLKKLTILAGALLPVVLFIATLAAILFSFGWLSAVLVPAVGIFWTIIAGLTGDKGNWIHSMIGLVVGIALAAIAGVEYGLPIALFTVSLFIQRMTFVLAEYWVKQMVSHSYGAYDMLVEHLYLQDIEDEEAPAASA